MKEKLLEHCTDNIRKHIDKVYGTLLDSLEDSGHFDLVYTHCRKVSVNYLIKECNYIINNHKAFRNWGEEQADKGIAFQNALIEVYKQLL